MKGCNIQLLTSNKYSAMKRYDYLLVGAGLYNAVFAYMAREQGKRCLVIDRRPHLGGNVYCECIEGIHVHKYGPHIFHTNNKAVWDFVNRIVPFNRFTLQTVANYKGHLYNLPFNMNTFYRMWGVGTPVEAMRMIKSQCGSIDGFPANLEEQAISLVGYDIYNTLIKGYTEKQWGRACHELPAFIIRRLPVRYTYDNNYFNDLYQGVPEGGYNRLINGLLQGVECLTSCDYFEKKPYWDSIADKIVYSGAIDEYFGYVHGHLEYRSLRFVHNIHQTENVQGCAIMNYTDSATPYTRTVEHKHFDINNRPVQESPVTVVTTEYPVQWMKGQEPYYPINDDRNNRLYETYRAMAAQEQRVLFGGRLAEYKYYDMTDVVEQSMKRFENEI